MAEQQTPVVIDLGKQKRKRIKQLKRGEGKLMREVSGVLDEVRARMGADAAGKELVPVVMIYRRKPRRGGLLPLLT